jgi:restriction endonuclease Mrr
MAEMFFDGTKVKLKSLIKAIHNPNERIKWDKDVEHGEYFETVCNGKALLFHQRIKSAISFIQRRDFLEKKIKFKVPITDDGSSARAKKRARTFIVFSSIPDEILPSEPSVTRATNIIGIHMFERLPDGRLFFRSVM